MSRICDILKMDMYCEYYGLREKPFSVTSDPAFFFLSSSHREALSHLVYGINERKGVIVISGEIGTGKTTLCRVFLGQTKQKNVKTAFVINPNFSTKELLEAIVADFGIFVLKKTKLSLVEQLNRFLLEETAHGSNAVLIVDEAQNLKPNQLEEIRLLSNLETDKDKLLQIVLVGQPELKLKLSLESLVQLQQRVAVRYHIKPLGKNEVREYIGHRLKIAGSSPDRIKFTDEAQEIIYNYSQGVPRLLNIICDRCLLAGFAAQVNTIGGEITRKCIKELDQAKGP
ncbi:MAG: AAA family ATPase [Candidatus Omnitrophota bacterium]